MNRTHQSATLAIMLALWPLCSAACRTRSSYRGGGGSAGRADAVAAAVVMPLMGVLPGDDRADAQLNFVH
jgi:hypothetical protein